MIRIRLPSVPALAGIISFPNRGLSVNTAGPSSRLSKSGLVKAYRREAGQVFMVELRQRSVDRSIFPLKKPTALVTFYGPGQRQDPDNLMASLKPVWDGAQDAGVLLNDREMFHLPPLFEIDKKKSYILVRFYAEPTVYDFSETAA